MLSGEGVGILLLLAVEGLGSKMLSATKGSSGHATSSDIQMSGLPIGGLEECFRRLTCLDCIGMRRMGVAIARLLARLDGEGELFAARRRASHASCVEGVEAQTGEQSNSSSLVDKGLSVCAL